ncbi:MAG: ORF6N domain-containing protein [Flavobacteriia bacterium]|jgi:hypothetical protein
MELQLIQSKIYIIRGQKVLMDKHLAEMYGIETKRLKEAVKRNFKRFPLDFMFQLTKEEYDALRSQFASLEIGRGKFSKYLPYVFTEQGVAMLSSVLNSEKAIEVNIYIMRSFVLMREFSITYDELAKRISALEMNYSDVYEALNFLIEKDKKSKVSVERTKLGYKIQ